MLFSYKKDGLIYTGDTDDPDDLEQHQHLLARISEALQSLGCEETQHYESESSES